MESLSKMVCDGMEDRLSELPSSIHNCILSRMPIRDAARMSLLSTTWRYIWTTITEIKFGKGFFSDIYNRNKDMKTFLKIVSDILLVHNGPILKFSMHIPLKQIDLPLDLDRWLLFVSNNGIKTLDIDNHHKVLYKLPSCIFLCTTLTSLKVRNCILKPPRAFIGFQNLVELILRRLSFAADESSNLLVNAQQLRKLEFAKCTGIEHLKIHAPKLVQLHVRGSHEVDWQWFENNQLLKVVQVELKVGGSTKQKKTINLEKFIGNLPRVYSLILDGFSLKFLAPCRDSARLPTLSRTMTTLRLRKFAVSDSYQISCCLFLLRSYPNLEKLEISVADMKKSMVDESATRFLDAGKCNDMKMEKLKVVKIEDMQGYEVQLLLVKLLLACSLSLEKMVVKFRKEIDVTQRYSISKQVSRICRASSRLKLFSQTQSELVIEYLIL